jgi:hypothetical protein
LNNWEKKVATDKQLARLADGAKGLLYVILEKLVDEGGPST